MRSETLLLALVVLVSTLGLAATAVILLKLRLVQRRKVEERPRASPDMEAFGQELQRLRSDLGGIHSDLEALGASVREVVMRMESNHWHREPTTANLARDSRAETPVAGRYEAGENAGARSTGLTLEEAARRLVEECDTKPVERLSDVPDWVREHGYRLESIAGTPDDWFLAVLAGDNEGLVIPNMRRPMGRIDLGPFFDVVNYNGIDPLRGEKVGDFARVIRTGGRWTVTTRGRIQG